jgi:hypothetical protein
LPVAEKTGDASGTPSVTSRGETGTNPIFISSVRAPWIHGLPFVSSLRYLRLSALLLQRDRVTDRQPTDPRVKAALDCGQYDASWKIPEERKRFAVHEICSLGQRDHCDYLSINVGSARHSEYYSGSCRMCFRRHPNVSATSRLWYPDRIAGYLRLLRRN